MNWTKWPRRAEPRPARPGRHLRVEALEDRLTPAGGTLDATFAAATSGKFVRDYSTGGTIRFDDAKAVVRQPDGKLVLVGSLDRSNTDKDFLVTRLNADGTLDGTFGTSGGYTAIDFRNNATRSYDAATSVALDPSTGDILVAGGTDQPDLRNGAGGLPALDFAVARLSAGGLPVTGFGGSGTGKFVYRGYGIDSDPALAVVVDGDGRTVVAGGAGFGTNTSDYAILQLAPSGALNWARRYGFGQNFGTFSTIRQEYATAVTVDPFGRIVAAGPTIFGSSSMGALRVGGGGAIDTGFGDGGFFIQNNGYDARPSDVEALADGSLLLLGTTGTFSNNTSHDDAALIRVTPAGQPDNAFGVGVGYDNGTLFSFSSATTRNDFAASLALRPDGKIVAAGTYAVNSTDQDWGAVQFNANGTIDGGFGNNGVASVAMDFGGGNGASVGGVVVLPNGSIVVAGGVQRTTAGNWDVAAVRFTSSSGGGPVFTSTMTDNTTVLLNAQGGFGPLSAEAASALDVDDAGNVVGVFSSGTWRWTPATGWRNLSSLRAEGVRSFGTDGFFADFGASGFWRWTSAGGWGARLSGGNVTVFDASDSGAAFVSLPDGTWRWTPSGGWGGRISAAVPTQLQADAAGNLYAVYPDIGTWRWQASNAVWGRLSGFAAESIAVSANGTFYGDFGSQGTFVFAPNVTTGGLVRITTSNAVSLSADASGNLLADYGREGLFRWSFATGMQSLGYLGGVEQITADAGGALFVDFGGPGGLWVWNGTWSKLTAANPTVMRARR